MQMQPFPVTPTFFDFRLCKTGFLVHRELCALNFHTKMKSCMKHKLDEVYEILTNVLRFASGFFRFTAHCTN
jgi:hypothetical protein